MSDASIRFVYMTAGDEEEARRLARMLVSERLAACVNLLGSMQSFYWWEGRVEDAAEIAMVAKTTAERFPVLMERLTAEHSYDCPCVVALPVTDGNPAFLHWIVEETTRSTPDKAT